MHPANVPLSWSPLNRPPPAFVGWDEPFLWGPRERVCIYGGGIGREEAPLDDSSWVVWAPNLIVPFDSFGEVRADLWWDVHQRHAQTADDLRWIASCRVPVVVPADLSETPRHPVVLPVERILGRWPHAPFACTFAYQMALAILDGFVEIGLYGVELAWGSRRERSVEWASVNWWIGHAEALGIRVRRPSGSRLGRHPRLYGVEYDAEKGEVEDYLDLCARIDGLDERERKKNTRIPEPFSENDHVRRLLGRAAKG